MSYNDNNQKNNADLEILSKNFLNELVLNVVLRELPTKELRIEFFNIINSNDYDSADAFINQHIPDFKEKLLARTKELLNK